MQDASPKPGTDIDLHDDASVLHCRWRLGDKVYLIMQGRPNSMRGCGGVSD